jgi:uncharacterized protein (TIGR00369 family)
MSKANSYRQKLSLLKKEYHPKCIFNDLRCVIGRDLEVDFENDGVLVADFFCHERYQGYDGMIHGGVIAALLDAAMVQCLMGHGVIGYTARMNIRYIKPVKPKQYVKIRCSIKQVHFNRIYKLFADITEDRKEFTIAHASFYKIN